MCVCVFFFKQNAAKGVRIKDWRSDGCSSDLNCKMRTSEGREFVIEGHFDKPNAFSRGQGAPTRPVTINISKPLQFEGSGTALMGWSSDRDGWHKDRKSTRLNSSH